MGVGFGSGHEWPRPIQRWRAGGAGNPKSEGRRPKQIRMDGNGAIGKRKAATRTHDFAVTDLPVSPVGLSLPGNTPAKKRRGFPFALCPIAGNLGFVSGFEIRISNFRLRGLGNGETPGQRPGQPSDRRSDPRHDRSRYPMPVPSGTRWQAYLAGLCLHPALGRSPSSR